MFSHANVPEVFKQPRFVRNPLWHELCKSLFRENVINQYERNLMLYWTILFLIIALVAGFLGFGGVAGTAMGIAQVLFVIFLVLFLASLIMSLARK
jgi:uncharacterized membrane protein YtjA (UPF0391 family)